MPEMTVVVSFTNEFAVKVEGVFPSDDAASLWLLNQGFGIEAVADRPIMFRRRPGNIKAVLQHAPYDPDPRILVHSPMEVHQFL